QQHDVALLITDQRMPGMTGIELLKRAAALRPHMVRIILTGYADMEARVEAVNCGQVYRYVAKPWGNEDLRLTAARALEHYEANRARHELAESNERLSRRIQATSCGIIRAVSDALEAKDRHIYGHGRRVSGYATAVARRMRLGVELLEQITLAALLHDIGKIATPDRILLKPDVLTADERGVVRQHAERGARMLARVPGMEEAAELVRYHHEDYDGGGYPEGLAGEQIPVGARIIRVADAYDAMTSPRPFRDALDHQAAVAELLEGAGSRFDPEAVRAFCGLEALAKIRDHIARGDFGSQFLPVRPPSDLSSLTPEILVKEVAAEPALAAAVLRADNAGRPVGERTASLYAACARLGPEAVREIIARAEVCERVSYEAEALREHARRCATAAMLLAEKTGELDPEAAYTAGLLHDLGEALLRSLFPEEAERIIWLGHPFRLEREVAAFGVDHTQVGQWVVDACHVPAGALSVQAHHDVRFVNDPAALLLHLADAVADAHDSSEVAALDALTQDRLSPLRLSRADVARVHQLTAELVGERFDRAAA
ncbi:MAG TPA: HD domain-containing phosphohydrolase, partial [Pyrinomonadaceae bacterium]|nr:HD domain-containing phosphohydrolase [Pyrinomonadaceae bacterium]